jgi:peroxiredoxin
MLVYFWSVSHAPCVAELRYIKNCYERYHDRGFNVVGVNLDRGRLEVNEFVKKEELPWPTLFDQHMPQYMPTLSEQHNGGPRSMATCYGVTEIPTAFVVDKEGKVVSLLVPRQNRPEGCRDSKRANEA